jgi:hypothetical protein
LVLDNLETPWDPKAERRSTEESLAALAAIPASQFSPHFVAVIVSPGQRGQ